MSDRPVNPSQSLDRLDQLESFLRQDPRNPALFSDVIHAAVQAGLPGRARAALDRADPWFAGSSTLRHLEAVVLLSEQRYAEARTALQDVLASGAEQTGVLFNLGYACLRSGDAAAAVGVLGPLLAREDAPDATLAYLMRSQHHAGDAAAAIASWESAPARFKTPEAMAVASLAHLDLEHIDAARTLSDAALAAGSRSTEALVARATVAVADGDEARAEALLARASEQLPNDGRVFSAVGVARMANGDLAQAEQALLRSVALMPQHVGTWHALAWCQIALGKLDAAGHSFGQALTLDRNFGETHGGLAVVDAAHGRVAAAREGIERAKRLDPRGMAFRYAEALLAGTASDQAAMRDLATRLLRQRDAASGIRLLDRL